MSAHNDGNDDDDDDTNAVRHKWEPPINTQTPGKWILISMSYERIYLKTAFN